jgi:hypothetical protein
MSHFSTISLDENTILILKDNKQVYKFELMHGKKE